MYDLLIKVGVKADRAKLFAEPLEAAIALHDINKKNEFLAQLLHESNMLLSVEENLSYSTLKRLEAVYGKKVTGRQDLIKNPEGLANVIYAGRNGNKESGDGWKYRGRGLLQITGRANYKLVGHESDPEALTQPTDACLTAALWWVNNGCDTLQSFDLITRRINGPAMAGKLERQALLRKLQNGLA